MEKRQKLFSITFVVGYATFGGRPFGYKIGIKIGKSGGLSWVYNSSFRSTIWGDRVCNHVIQKGFNFFDQ